MKVPDRLLSTEPGTSINQDALSLAFAAGRIGTWEFALESAPCLQLSGELRTILGLDDNEHDGSLKSFLARLYPSDRRALLKKILAAIRGGADLEVEFRFGLPGQAPIWLLGRGKLLVNSGEEPVRLVGIAMDVTAQKQESQRVKLELERRLAERSDQLQNTEKELEVFCYSVSHDLRAPLRSIRGFNEVLLERYTTGLEPRAQEFLRRACEASHQMDQLIDGLLKLSRVGRSELVRRPVDLSQLATTIAGELNSGNSSRQVSFQIAPQLRAVGDERLLRILLENLLRNAWKFTSKQPAARIEFGSVSTPEPAFFVRDNGVGFDPEYTGRLFGVFQRLHPATEFPGTGTGLAIVRRIVTRHGGRAWAEGAIDHGATFFFSLPSDEPI